MEIIQFRIKVWFFLSYTFLLEDHLDILFLFTSSNMILDCNNRVVLQKEHVGKKTSRIFY